MPTGVDHAAIAATDPASLARWYCDALGLRILFRNDQEPATYLVGGDSGGMIEIMPDNGDLRQERRFYAPGISHLALSVSDFDATMAALAAAGVDLAEHLAAAGGGRIANFHDPEGNAIQIITRTRDLRGRQGS